MLKNIWNFNTLHEMVSEIENAPHVDGRENSSQDKRGGDWVDTNSLEETFKYIRDGKDYDGLATNLKDLGVGGKTEQNKMFLSPVGMNPVVPLAIAGVPCSMVNMYTTRRESKILNIIYAIGTPWSVSEKDIVKNATELMHHIYKLERDGYRCNVYIMDTQKSASMGYLCKIKNDRETLNLKKLAFPMISPSILRRLQFALSERLYETDITHDGYGKASHYESDIKAFMSKVKPSLKHYEVWEYNGKMFEV